MIEQQNNQLLLSFPSPEAARAFAQFLTTLVNLPASATFGLPSDQSQGPETLQDSPEPGRSRHVVLTEDRMDQIFNQRASGQASHQRLLRAQTTLRDGVLPFSKPGNVPSPSGQPSPRQKAQQEGTFADGGLPKAAALRPLRSPDPQQADPVADPPEAKRRSVPSKLPKNP